jgi:hypothetical protein
VKKNEVRKLLVSMETHGFRRFDHANFIAIVMKKDDLEGELTQDPYTQDGLPTLEVKVEPTVPTLVKAASGQHRFHAVKAKWDKLKTELNNLQSEGKKKKLAENVKLDEIQRLGKELETLRWWGATVYDEGEFRIL